MRRLGFVVCHSNLPGTVSSSIRKPVNIMLGCDGIWKYAGLARRKAEKFNENTTGGGTPWYIAPEQDLDRYSAEVAPPADMFALAMCHVSGGACFQV